MAPKTLLVTLGDPSGIGPEVLVKCLHRISRNNGVKPIVIGELEILRNTAVSLGLSISFAEENSAGENDVPVHALGLLQPGEIAMGKISAACGHAAFAYFEYAVRECLAGKADGIVTAPLNKEAMNLGGHRFMGHTDILEKMTGVAGPVMALWHPKLVVSHVTDHLSLRAALDAITAPRIRHVAALTWSALRRAGNPEPRIALAGVNPHAGENGLLGREEIEILKPAMMALRQDGIPTSGPYPADTVFLQGLQGRFDAVLAMYHDQGFGPMKTLDFAHGVNCTLGLPFVRTSPDHGTAFEIAGQGRADPESMIAAWNLACRLLESREKAETKTPKGFPE